MKKILKVSGYLFLITMVFVLVLQIVNNALDIKYLIDPFERGDDIMELKSIASEKLEQNSQSLMILLFLLLLSVLCSLFQHKS